jgi:putative membrane protein
LYLGWLCYFIYLGYLFTISENANTRAFTKIVEIQEYKLFRYIGAPAMWATLITGIVMLFLNYSAIFASGIWMYLKVA